MTSFRGRLFSRVVPTVKDIGLWGERVRKAFTDMGVMDYAKIDVAEQLANDGRVAEEFDKKMFVESDRRRVMAYFLTVGQTEPRPSPHPEERA